MKEKELENWIFNLSQTPQGRRKLGECDLRSILEEPMKQQVSLGGYGIIDLLQEDEDMFVGIELKTRNIKFEDITQCCRYYEALNSYKQTYIHLIVPKSGFFQSDLRYVAFNLKFLRVQEYTIKPEHIIFNS